MNLNSNILNALIQQSGSYLNTLELISCSTVTNEVIDSLPLHDIITSLWRYCLLNALI